MSNAKTLFVKFKNLNKLDPEDVEVVDSPLVGFGTGPDGKYLTFRGAGRRSDSETGFIYEYNEKTTDEFVEEKISKIKANFPQLEIIYEIGNFL